MKVTIFDKLSGQIKAVMQASDPRDIELNLSENDDWIEDVGDPGLQYVKERKLVSKHPNVVWAVEQERAMEELRQKRNQMLAATDWTQLNDADLTEEEIAEWRDYRRALKDLPARTRDARNPKWPTLPKKP